MPPPPPPPWSPSWLFYCSAIDFSHVSNCIDVYVWHIRYSFHIECLYEYLREPPSDITDCNPYSTTSDLVLQCQVSVPISEVGNAEIQWFNEGQQITLEGFYPLAQVDGIVVELENGTDRSIITSTLRLDGDRFFIQLDQTGSGRYHCQIVVDGSESIAISNQLVIDSDQEIYSGNGDCSTSTAYFEENMRCAKYSPNNISSTTEAATEAETEGRSRNRSSSNNTSHSNH